MCSEVKGLRSAMSIPADLLLSGALAQPASTIVQPNCLKIQSRAPLGPPLRSNQTNNRKISRGLQYFLKSELIRRLGIAVQHSQNHPVITTGRRAITLCRPSSSSHDSQFTWPFMSESPVFEEKRLLASNIVILLHPKLFCVLVQNGDELFIF